MDLSHEEIEEPSKYNEDDKTFVHQLIDNEGKSWDPNLFHETFNKSHPSETGYESETKQLEDSDGVGESRSFKKEFISEDRNIRNQKTKCESDEDLKIDISYEEIIPKIKVESSIDEDVTNSPQVIDREGKSCESSEDCKIDIQYDEIITKSEVESTESSEDENTTIKSEVDDGEFLDDVKSFEDPVKEEIVQEEVYTNENQVEIQRKAKKCKFTQCDYRTTKKCTMEQHKNGVKSHKCPVCDFQTATKSYIKHHLNSKHLGQGNHKCSQCDYRAANKGRLKIHVESVHLGLKKHKCSQCDYRAAHKGSLRIHMESVHLGLKKHKCSQCDYRAAHKGSLKIHMESVHLGRNYQCSQCDYRAANKGRLKIHTENVHLGLKKHKCSQCDYRAATKQSIKVHTERIHLKKIQIYAL